MDQSGYQQSGKRLSLFDPPLMTIIVYGGLFIVYQADYLDSPLGRLLLIPALLGLLIVPITTFRALGNAVMSRFGGGEVLRFTSGPLLFRQINGQLKAGLNTRWAWYPGTAVTAPGESANLRSWIRWRETGPFLGMVVYVLLVLLVTAWLQNQAFIGDDPERARIVQTISFGLSVLIITLGVWQLINRHIPRIWRMSRGKQGAEREAAIISMTSLMMVGRRPRYWPAELPALAIWDEDESIEGLYGHRFAYLHALDSGDLEEAERHFQYLDDHADRLPSRMREQLVELERPFVEAWIRGNGEKARELLGDLKNTIIERYKYRRIQAAVFLVQGEDQTAREFATEGLNAAATKMDDGEVLAEVAVLEEILERTGGDVVADLTGVTSAQEADS